MPFFSRSRVMALAVAGAATIATVAGASSLAHADVLPTPTPTFVGPPSPTPFGDPTPTPTGTTTPTVPPGIPTRTPTYTPTATPTVSQNTPTPCLQPNFYDTYCVPAALPTDVQATSIASTSATFAWSSKLGPAPYYIATPSFELFLDGTKVATSTGLTTRVDGLTPNTQYTLVVTARLSPLNPVSSSAPVTFTTLADGAPSPTPAPLSAPAPKNLRLIGTPSDTSVRLEWDDGGLAEPAPTAGYDVFSIGSDNSRIVRGGANATGKTISGLTPGTTYTFVVADQVRGAEESAPLTVTTTGTTPIPTNVTYTATGSATLKTLTKGAIPLTGFFSQGIFDPSTGALSLDLALNPSTAKLTALGFLPVVAKVNFVDTTGITGVVTGTTLSASDKARIKLPSITAFGTQIAGGASCQTTQPSTIPFTSVGPFSVGSGGTVAGTFSIGNLSGCGSLTGLVSPLTAGGGNSILLRLARLTF